MVWCYSIHELFNAQINSLNFDVPDSLLTIVAKLNIDQPYDSAIQLLGINLKEMQSVYQRNTCMPIVAKALFKCIKKYVNLGAYQGMN